MPTSDLKNGVAKSDEVEILSAEYQVAGWGYDNRDALIPTELSFATGLFAGLLTLSFYIYVNYSFEDLFLPLISFIGVGGLMAMIGIISDMEATSSSKAAIRRRMEDIEKIFKSMGVSIPSPRLYRTSIGYRPKNRIERILNAGESSLLSYSGTAMYFMMLAWAFFSLGILYFSRQPTYFKVASSLIYLIFPYFLLSGHLKKRRSENLIQKGVLSKDMRFNKDYWDKIYSTVDPWAFKSSKYEQDKYDQQIDLVRRELKSDDVSSILELGCAEGAFTEKLVSEFRNAKVTGVDISSNAIRRAEDNFKKIGLSNRVNFVRQDAVEFIKSQPKAKYDLIFWSEGIYYVAPPSTTKREFESMIAHLNGMLKEGGLFCSANIINQAYGDEELLTDKKRMDLIFEYLRHSFIMLERDSYTKYKEESERNHDYEIWLFKKKN